MNWLVTGIVLFFGVHLLPSFPRLRESLANPMTEYGYKGLFALLSLAGFVMIVVGYADTPRLAVYTPPSWGHWLPIVVMPFSLMLLAAAYVPSNIKRVTRHPMLWSVFLWALAHLFANGDLAGVLLFGSFAVYAPVAMYSANRRGATLSERRVTWAYELVVIAIGVVAYVLIAHYHQWLFGISPF